MGPQIADVTAPINPSCTGMGMVLGSAHQCSWALLQGLAQPGARAGQELCPAGAGGASNRGARPWHMQHKSLPRANPAVLPIPEQQGCGVSGLGTGVLPNWGAPNHGVGKCRREGHCDCPR